MSSAEAVLAWLAWAVNAGGANPAELRQMFEIGQFFFDSFLPSRIPPRPALLPLLLSPPSAVCCWWRQLS